MTSEERSPREDGDRPQRSERSERPAPKRYGRGRKVCRFCVDHMRGVDYKDIGRLRMYISDRGKIEPRRKTGTCQRHQRLVATAVKRARHLAFLPYTVEHIRQTGVFPIRG